MEGTLLEGLTSPQTQSFEAIKALLAWRGRAIDPLPTYIQMDGLALVLSAKKDQYYTVTPKACSCASFVYRGGPCKHQRKFFSKSEIQRIPDEVIEDPILAGFDGPQVV